MCGVEVSCCVCSVIWTCTVRIDSSTFSRSGSGATSQHERDTSVLTTRSRSYSVRQVVHSSMCVWISAQLAVSISWSMNR